MRRMSGFSLMEMMVVLLIVAIVAAASAPMVSKKLSGANSVTGMNCNWKSNKEDSKSIAYNSTGINNKSVIIGAKQTDLQAGSTEKPRLYIKSKNTDNPHIRFAFSDDVAFNLQTTKESIWFSNKDIPSGHSAFVAIGKDVTASTVATAIGYMANAGSTGAVAIGDHTTVGSSAGIAIGSNSTVTGSSSSGIAIGQKSKVSGSNGVAIGNNSSAESNSVAILGSADSSKQVVIGGYDHEVKLGGCKLQSGSITVDKNMSAGEDISAGNNITADGNIRAYGNLNVSGTTTCGPINSNGYITSSGTITAPKIEATDIEATDIKADTLTVKKLIVTDNVDVDGDLGTSNLYVWNNANIGSLDVRGNADLNINSGSTYIRATGTHGKIYSMDSGAGDRGYLRIINDCDRRLKNVGEVFTSGLEEIKKLEVFNYVYKKDSTKTPHVGVMAQDLMKIFPNAVFKGDDGFYRIRMEDMFYALVNAVKELDKKIDLLVEKQKKIDELEKRVDTLEKRLIKLEKLVKEK